MNPNFCWFFGAMLIGVLVAMKDKAGLREWCLILGGFGLVALGAICQIVGLLNSP